MQTTHAKHTHRLINYNCQHCAIPTPPIFLCSTAEETCVSHLFWSYPELKALPGKLCVRTEVLSGTMRVALFLIQLFSISVHTHCKNKIIAQKAALQRLRHFHYTPVMQGCEVLCYIPLSIICGITDNEGNIIKLSIKEKETHNWIL